jgi:hypothetical protein
MPDLKFARFRAALSIELRLLVFNWIYPVLHLLWMALLVWMFAGRDDRSAQALLETTLGRLSIGLISLVGLFLAGISASRSARVKFFDLEQSFPTGFEVPAGRWLAGTFALLPFMLAPLILAARQGPLASLLDGMPLFLSEAGLTIAFTMALAWALLSRVKVGRWSYPVLAAGWLGFLLGPTMLADRFPSASLLNFMRQGVSFYSELWGRLVYGSQPDWFNLFYLGLLALCLAALMLNVSMRRFYRLSLPGLALLTGALLLSGLAGTRYVAGVQAAQTAPAGGAPPAELYPFTVSDYHLTLDMGDPVLPRFHAQMTVVNSGATRLDRLIFRLNPALMVKDASLPLEQSGEFVSVRLAERLAPGEDLSLTLAYEGRLRVESISDGVVAATDFIEPGGVRLTPQANWYPLPAQLSQPFGLHDPAHIRLEVKNSGALPFAANLPSVGKNTFAADAAGWVFLVASPHLVVEPMEEVTLITSTADLERGREIVSPYREQLLTMPRFFPDADVHGLMLMVLGEEGGLPEGTPPAAGYPLVILPRYALTLRAGNPDNQQAFVIRTLVSDLWWLSGGILDARFAGPVTSLNLGFDAVVGFLNLYASEHGDAGQMMVRLHSTAQQGWVDENQAALIELYRQGGQNAMVTLFRQMMLRPDELRALPYEDLPRWLQSAGGER